ncbi:hypothetical protein GGF46_004628 [Coemansia sp. RSA 552]|nr:hypothetical protein GGF46_004628 [Coemansia sp. RSA 552]
MSHGEYAAGSSKRRAAGGAASSGDSKRARSTKATHAAQCDDPECSGCADGAVALADDILDLSAAELLGMARQEEAAGTDRAVVTKLYEAALAKLGGQKSLLRVQALLQFAEFVDYSEYAAEVLPMADAISPDNDADRAQLQVFRGRARVLTVCLDQANRRESEDIDSDDEDSSAATPISGEESLRQGLQEIADGVQVPGVAAGLVGDTLASLSIRHERGSLICELRRAIMDSALAIAFKSLRWDVSDTKRSKDPEASSDDLAPLACKIAVYWTLAAAECAVEGDQIEARIAPAAKYLESASTADAECCKLRAQLLIVLSGLLDDEDAALSAYDTAIDALKQALRLRPDDADVACQLEDMGIEI